MATYINGMGNISPQKTWDDSVLPEPLSYQGDRLTCDEPDYLRYIEAKHLRRMSRIIKMGVTAGFMALKQAGITIPDGIITGTAYGCLDDTGIFLNKLIENQEHALNPTPFIQSTHNTIGSQIALLIQCQGYNQTYTQGAFSFENALMDAVLELKDTPSQSLLVGGVDEITSTSHAIQKRFGVFKTATNSLDLFTGEQGGSIHGEGAAYFVLSGEKVTQHAVCIAGIKMLYKPSDADLGNALTSLLETASLRAADIDFVLLGKCGDKKFDMRTSEFSNMYFGTNGLGVYKHLCGEYPTASAFAVWIAAKIIQENHIPGAVVIRPTEKPIRRVLIYNPYFGTHHSMILVQAC
jgi:3-oxoacyl-(acyl-carrier-protein) synthase